MKRCRNSSAASLVSPRDRDSPGSSLRRVVVAGGDSSGAVASHLGVQALTVAAGLRPGAPLCRAWSDDARRDGLELVLKGGQMGTPSFYGEVLSGQINP